MFINKILRKFNLRLIKTTPVFDWIGGEYYFPLYEKDLKIVDKHGKELPLKLENEEDVMFVIRAVTRALAN